MRPIEPSIQSSPMKATSIIPFEISMNLYVGMAVAAIFFLTACASSNGPTFADDLNRSIGREFVPRDSFIVLSRDQKFTEYEYERRDGCRYAYKVENASQIITAWRSTSDDLRACIRSYRDVGA